jgi:hypothetical protein
MRSPYEQSWQQLEAARRRFQRMLLMRDIITGTACVAACLGFVLAVVLWVR